MKILILNNKIEDNTFLKSQFGISEYRELFIGKDTYIKNLVEKLKIFSDDDSRIVLVDKFPSNVHELEEKVGVLNDEDQVFFYKTCYYPVDSEKLSLIFEKSLYTQNLVQFNDLETAYKLTFKEFKEKQFKDLEKDSLIINLQKNFLDIKKTSDILQLFSNNFELRFFNHLKEDQNYFLKSSKKKDKMQAEYNFLSNLPSNLKPFYPQVGELRIQSDSCSYQIEKIYMFDLSKLLINGILKKETVLDKVLEKLCSYLSSIPTLKFAKEEKEKAIRKDILEKNEERFQELSKLEVITKLDSFAKILGFETAENFHNLVQDELKKNIPGLIKDDFYFSHGDLCFSNILFDPNSFSIKFIDPRGYLKDQNESFRTVYYDLAKLSHSFHGLYDLIIYDLIEIVFDNDGELGFNHLLDDHYKNLLQNKFDEFITLLGYDIKLIRLVESSLFLSMIPLHQDSQKKMLAQFIQATKSFSDFQDL